MRKIRELLRLRLENRLPQRAIAESLGLSQGAISTYLSRARAAGIGWQIPEELDDARLEALLFPPPRGTPADQRPMPDWAWVHRELRRPNVTLALLWEEYRAGAPDGFGYSWFCDLYRGWAGRLKPTMRQVHLAGEKLFVDFAGRTAEVIDGLTGQIIPVQIFVAVLGASSFTYAEAVWSQKLEDSLQRLGLPRVDLLLIHDLDIRYHQTCKRVEALLTELHNGGARALLPFSGHKGSSIAFMIEIVAGALTGGPFGFADRSHEYPGAQTPKAGQTVILIDPLLVPGNRHFERIEGLFEAVVASGVERLPAERRYARRQQSLRDGITVSDRDWAILQELLT